MSVREHRQAEKTSLHKYGTFQEISSHNGHEGEGGRGAVEVVLVRAHMIATAVKKSPSLIAGLGSSTKIIDCSIIYTFFPYDMYDTVY